MPNKKKRRSRQQTSLKTTPSPPSNAPNSADLSAISALDIDQPKPSYADIAAKPSTALLEGDLPSSDLGYRTVTTNTGGSKQVKQRVPVGANSGFKTDSDISGSFTSRL